MKKIIVISLLVFLSCSELNASENNVVETRHVLGQFLNKAVRELKVFLGAAEKELQKQKDEIKDLKERSQKIAKNSSKTEINPTILEHGNMSVKNCNYKTSDLIWDMDKGWDCRNLNYNYDCIPASGEERKSDKKGNSTCYQIGKCNVKSTDWGLCIDDKGERYSQIGNFYTNTKTNKVYQVDESVTCKGDVKRYKQACGPNGEESNCECHNNGKYFYDEVNKKSHCLSEPICSEGFSFEKGICIKPGEFARNKAAGAGEEREFKRHFNYYPQHFYIHVWTEDLLANIKYTSDSGAILFEKYIDRYIESKGHDHIKRSGYADFVATKPGTLYVWVKEGGRAASDDLGYTIKLIDDTGAKCSNLKGVYNSKLQKCIDPVPMCLLK